MIKRRLLRLIVFVLLGIILSGCGQSKPKAKTLDFINMSFEEREELMQAMTAQERLMMKKAEEALKKSKEAAEKARERLEFIKQKAREAEVNPDEHLENIEIYR